MNLSPGQQRAPGEKAALRLAMARSAFQIAARAQRLNRGGDKAVKLKYRSASKELSAAINAFLKLEDLPYGK